MPTERTEAILAGMVAAFEFFGLRQRDDLHQFIKRPKTARKDDQRAREMCEPQFAHEKIMELEP